ncbi:hypothetical protein H7F15_17500 [Pontibacter sp. Tf4]|uniref:hypothetical protein n=1 Tax=Pontibacter sp. Tf4 TaxID=2761620 RepID=UPI001628B661|nr:hypothetical protein [Pontibacter sp. Tf4]MBB6612841.1 hypothetical protein [Pontibacter sp. Tf4]
MLAVLPLFAQTPTQPNRLELDLDFYKTEAELIATPDSSLLLFTRTDRTWTNPPVFQFTRYNHQLQAMWTEQVMLHPISKYMAHYTALPHTYIAFSGKDKHEFQFVKLNLQTGAVQKHEFRIEAIDSVYVFKVVDDNYFLVSRSGKDNTPTLLHLNEKTGEIKPLPSVYGSESAFSDILVQEPESQVSVVLSESNGRVSRLQTKLFDAGGKLLNNYFMHPKAGQRPLVAEITPGDTTERLLLGTYANRDLRYATGFFAAPVTSDGSDARYYSFTELKNFFKYMKPRREARARKREANRLKAGKEPGLQYRVLLHDVYPATNGYILTGEVYVTENNGSLYRMYTISGGSAQIPKLYRRTQAIALGFDQDGVLLWDNSFPLKDVESNQLRPTVEIVASPDGKVVIAHPDEDAEIHYQYMNQDAYTEEETSFELLPQNPDAKITSTNLSGIISWYGLNFAAYGWHRIKSPGSESRMVFYINKVSF